jgi:hypothetical protein
MALHTFGKIFTSELHTHQWVYFDIGKGHRVVALYFASFDIKLPIALGVQLSGRAVVSHACGALFDPQLEK